MPFKLKLVSLALLMLAAFAQPGLAENPERPAPAGGGLSLLPAPARRERVVHAVG